jgi:hypothetical protein
MSDDFDLSSIGIHLKDMAMGLQGGIASVFFLRRVKAWKVLGCVVLGMFSGNAFGPAIAAYFGMAAPPYYEAMVGASGLAGGTICYGVIKIARRLISMVEKRFEGDGPK